jgi:hypothetical protein
LLRDLADKIALFMPYVNREAIRSNSGSGNVRAERAGQIL